MIKFIYRMYMIYLLHTERGRRKTIRYLLARKERDGPSCLECGLCCLHCEAYNKRLKKCLIWEDAKRVFHCDRYPVVPMALKVDGLVDKCRYYWE